MLFSSRALACFVLLVAACSSDDDAAPGAVDGGATSAGDAARDVPTNDGGAPPVPTGVPDAAAEAGLPASGGINLTADGTTYALTRDAGASRAGNGYAIVAQDIQGTDLRNFTMIVTKGESSGGSTQYVVPGPGVYTCVLPGAPPFAWARMQYAVPGGSTYQNPQTPSCTVTITEFGEVGGRVKGTFSASLDRITGSAPTPIAVSGTFDVVRKN